jgi:hypothetical protein
LTTFRPQPQPRPRLALRARHHTEHARAVDTPQQPTHLRNQSASTLIAIDGGPAGAYNEEGRVRLCIIRHASVSCSVPSPWP